MNQWKVYTEVRPELLQRVQKDNKKLILIVGRQDCRLCTNLLTQIEEDKKTLSFLKKHTYLCFIDVQEGKHQRAIGNSLFQFGYPETYVFDAELKLFSHFNGSYNYIPQLKHMVDSSCFINQVDYAHLKFDYNGEMPEHYEHIRKENLPEMLGNSFLSAIYLETNPEKALKYAKRSIESGSFFYNNYIAYKCLLALDKPAEAETYKKQALAFQGRLDWVLFEDEFNDLGIPAPKIFVEFQEAMRKKHERLREHLKK